MRWKAEAEFKKSLQSKEIADDMELRSARLQEAKFMAHKAVEVIFHAFLGTVVAIHADRKDWEKFMLEKPSEEDVA